MLSGVALMTSKVQELCVLMFQEFSFLTIRVKFKYEGNLLNSTTENART